MCVYCMYRRELEQHRPSSPQRIGLLIEREVERERGRSEAMMLQYRERYAKVDAVVCQSLVWL